MLPEFTSGATESRIPSVSGITPATTPPTVSPVDFDKGLLTSIHEELYRIQKEVDANTQALYDKIDAYLAKCLSAARVTQVQCRNCIKDAIDNVHKQAENIAVDLKLPVEIYVAQLTHHAWETAEKLGCGTENQVSLPQAPISDPGYGGLGKPNQQIGGVSPSQQENTPHWQQGTVPQDSAVSGGGLGSVPNGPAQPFISLGSSSSYLLPTSAGQWITLNPTKDLAGNVCRPGQLPNGFELSDSAKPDQLPSFVVHLIGNQDPTLVYVVSDLVPEDFGVDSATIGHKWIVNVPKWWMDQLAFKCFQKSEQICFPCHKIRPANQGEQLSGHNTQSCVLQGSSSYPPCSDLYIPSPCGDTSCPVCRGESNPQNVIGSFGPTDATQVIARSIPRGPSEQTVDPQTGKACKPGPKIPCLQQFTGWMDPRTGYCYVLDPGSKKLSPYDILLGTSGNKVELSKWVQEVCEKRKKKEKVDKKPPKLNPYDSIGKSTGDCIVNIPSVGDDVDPLFSFASYLGFDKDAIEEAAGTSDSVFSPIRGVITGVISSLVRTIVGLGGKVLQDFVAQTGCNDPKLTEVMVWRTVVGLASKWISGSFSVVDQPLEYSSNLLCQTLLPNTSEALDQYLVDHIKEDKLKCWVEANGNVWDAWKGLIESRRSKVTPFELTVLLRRGVISESEYVSRLRNQGWLRNNDPTEIFELSNQVPPITDLMTYMTRDTADEQTIDWTQVDQLFAQKWTGKLEQWGYQQGIPREMALYSWRAHFHLPSPTAGYTMIHRLRPGKGGVANPTTYDDIRKLLIQDDMHPDWVDRMLEISYLPMGRIDIRRAYKLGVLSKDDIISRYQDIGYTLDDSKVLADYTEKDFINGLGNHRAIKGYVQGTLSMQETEELLRKDGVSQEVIQMSLGRADLVRKSETRKKCIGSIKRRYKLGEFDSQRLTEELMNLGLDPATANEVTAGAVCEFTRKSKEISASTLCLWLEQGLITQDQYFDRLVKIGYDSNDASDITESCGKKIGVRQKQKAEQQSKAEEARRRRLQKEGEQNAKKRQKEAQQLAKMQAARANAEKHRQQQILEAAENLSSVSQQTIENEIVTVKSIIQEGISVFGLTRDDAIMGAVTASEKLKKFKHLPYHELANQIFEGIATLLVEDSE